MILKTLHSYIIRELLRVFLLTATALTVLLAFGGMFKPLTKQGIEVSQLLVILLYLMPAMLAYAIPIAALFAAVLVYWRMSTDNELTACRAGGVSFPRIVAPAFVLGLAVASVDLVFVNYVVPHFLQGTERAVMKDFSKLLVSQISRQEKFQYDPFPLVVWADSATLEPPDPSDPDLSTVELRGLAATRLDRGKPTATVIAPLAEVTIRNLPSQNAMEVGFKLTDATVFDPSKAFKTGAPDDNGTKEVADNAFQTMNATVDSQIFDRPIRVPSQLADKPKFLNLRDLMALSADPYRFPQVSEVIDNIQQQYSYQQVARQVCQWWETQSNHGTKPVDFPVPDNGSGVSQTLRLYAGEAVYDPAAPPEQSVIFKSPAPGGVRIESWETRPGQTRPGDHSTSPRPELSLTYTCDQATLVLSSGGFSDQGLNAFLRLAGKQIMLENHRQKIPPRPYSAPTLPIGLPAADPPAPASSAQEKVQLVEMALASPDKDFANLGKSARFQIDRLDRTIGSELHSRGSFSLSCLTLVMLGAALGILLRGKNPLAVFVVGFVPAILLVLLITAGREVTEGSTSRMAAGIGLIWAGNVILILVVLAVYTKLLRH